MPGGRGSRGRRGGGELISCLGRIKRCSGVGLPGAREEQEVKLTGGGEGWNPASIFVVCAETCNYVGLRNEPIDAGINGLEEF